jgi:inhibitor of KinA sporulation pathway (predicted exonuclease)
MSFFKKLQYAAVCKSVLDIHCMTVDEGKEAGLSYEELKIAL